MLDRLRSHIAATMPELLGSRLGIAASGGLDSTLLIHLAHQLELDFTICHVNFKLRGDESDGDEQFLKKLASELKIHFHSKTLSANDYAQKNKVSTQVAARELRYCFFDELIQDGKVDFILTAHHLDDQLETFLINLGRGTGIHGLTGIPAINGNIRRPLLGFTRAEIENQAQSMKLDWREDSSNSTTKYQRNKLRHEVIPQLKNALPRLEITISDSLKHLTAAARVVDDEVLRFRESAIIKTQQGFIIHLDNLKASSNPAFLLHHLLKKYNFNPADYEQLLDSETGTQLESGDYRLLKNRDAIELYQLQKDQSDLKINGAGSYEMGDATFFVELLEVVDTSSTLSEHSSREVLLLDADQINFPLTLRRWKRGDRIEPFGMNGSKLVSDLLIDNKISRADKEKCLVLTVAHQILWVVGHRSSRHGLLNSETQRVIKIQVNR